LWKSTDPARKGDYARFFIQHPAINEGKKAYALNKRVACVAGDTLKTVGRDLFCNGKKIATALTHNRDGEPVEPFQWNGPIPKGKVLMLGDHLESYDARYWGFVDQSGLQRLVKII